MKKQYEFNPFHIDPQQDNWEWFKTHTITFYRFFKKVLTLPSGNTRLYNVMPFLLRELMFSQIDMMYPENRTGFLKNIIEHTIMNSGTDFITLSDTIPVKLYNIFYQNNIPGEIQGNPDLPITRRTDFLKENKKWCKIIFPCDDENKIENRVYPNDFFSLVTANVMEKLYQETTKTVTPEEEDFVNIYIKYLIMKSRFFKKINLFSPQEMITKKHIHKILEYFFFYANKETFLKTEAYLKFFEYTVTFYQNYTGITHIGMNLQDLLFCTRMAQISEITEKSLHIKNGIIISNNIIQNFWKRDETKYHMNIFNRDDFHVYGIIYKRSEKDIWDQNDPGTGSPVELENVTITPLRSTNEQKNNLIIDILGIPVYNITVQK